MANTRICVDCGLAHPEEVGCAAAAIVALRSLVKATGQEGFCRGCNARVWWVQHVKTGLTPYTVAGLNHFIDCPKRDDFRKKKG